MPDDQLTLVGALVSGLLLGVILYVLTLIDGGR
jgi:hypothetical protein